MVLKEALSEHFSLFGVTVNDEATLGKCLDLCDTYNLDEESLVETWMAFSVSHCQGDGPNVEYLCQMERKELKKDGNSSTSSILTGNSNAAGSSPFLKRDKNLSKIAVFNSSISSNKQFNDDDDIMEMYSPKTAAGTTKAKRLRSPEAEVGIVDVKIRAVESPFSPSTYSPKIATPSRRQSNLLNQGKILFKYGTDHKSWKNSDDNRIVKVSQSKDHDHVPSKSLYMYEKLLSKAAALDFVCEELGTSMCKTTNDIDRVESDQVGSYSRSQTQIQTYGRICCDSEGKLNTASVLLEGTKRISAGARVKLDLGKLNQYSIFPGQIVSVRGINPTGQSLVVQNLFFESPPPPPLELQRKSEGENVLDVVVAAGPFTATDNLEYEPLRNLIDYVEENKPHVFILIGPFVEFNHQEIQKCNMSDTFDEFFEQCVANVMRRLKDTLTQVVIVSSNRDVHHEPVYPTPEFRLRQKYPNLHLMPDPCMIDIDGLVIGMTSVDSLMHLGREEISFNAPGMDRLTRLATHVLAQKCFYPLVPSSEDLNVDTDLWEKYAFINRQPHILVLPSTLRYFCNNIYDCLAMNPERLVKGSFARLRVNYPMDNNANWKLADNVAVQILKI